MAVILTADQLHARLQHLAEQAGSQRALAKRLAVSPQYLCDVLGRRREISAAMAQRLGYQREVRFRKQEGVSGE